MSDNTERIVVEVDGSGAERGFNAIAAAAARADQALNSVAGSTNNAQQAVNTLLGVGQRAAQALNQTGQAGNNAAQGIGNAGHAAQGATTHFTSLQNAMFGGRGTGAYFWDLAADGIRMAMGFANSFIERMSSVQRTFSLLATMPGSDSKSEFEYLTRVANNYGLSLRAIQDDYAKLTLAAQNTTMTGEQVKRVFEQISMATRTLHMNGQQTQLTFLAVEQMLSKGKISMEELRKQFAERVPGAMQALAREMGVTYPLLEQYITKVGLASDKIVPILGDAVQRQFQGGIKNASQALDAELNRIQTSIANFFVKVNQVGGAEGMSNLLKTINGLLQSDTIAAVFANAMNYITNSLANFLKTLKPDDIEKFFGTAITFMKAFADMAIGAANAVAFLAKHTTALGAVLGAMAGGKLGSSFGIWGTIIGSAVGALAGAGTANVMTNRPTDDMDGLMKQWKSATDKANYFQGKIDDVKGGKKATGGSLEDWQNKLFDAKKERDELWTRVKSLEVAQASGSIGGPDLPGLAAQNPMLGSPAEMKKYLDSLRLSGTKTKDQLAAEKLFTRQQNFVGDLQAHVRAAENPEQDAFDLAKTNAEQMGIKEGNPLYADLQTALATLQRLKNEKAEQKSRLKTQQIESEFTNMKTASENDITKFAERHSLENLKQVDDTDWAAKARKMGNELDAVLSEQKKKWDVFAQNNPLYNFGFDREARLKEMREMGDAYIAEFKRIEQEKRSIIGGGKAFLKDWNESVNDYGKITQGFLQGTVQNVQDMLLNFVKTGEMSWKKLGEFVLDYIAKTLIAQAMTPLVNAGTSFLTSMAANFFAPGAGTAASSMYSLGSSGTSGLGLRLPGRAVGGTVLPGSAYLVGERGPEVLQMGNYAGYVTPNESLRGRGSSDVPPVMVSVHVDAGGSSSVTTNSNSDKLGRRIGEMVRNVIVDEKRPGGLLA